MGCDQTFSYTALFAGQKTGLSHRHEFKRVQQFPCSFNIRLIAGKVEGDKDRVGQASLGMFPVWGALGFVLGHPLRLSQPYAV
jgi:hypothetical protein